MLNANFESDYQIIQTPDAVVIFAQLNHDVRIIRLGGQHPPPNVRVWMGDSIGHWEGDALVVETSNLHPEEGWRSRFLMSSEAKIVERLTRVASGEILYEFTVDDPATFTEVWRAQMPLRAITQPLHEFGCHEGNYSLGNILGGVRREEADAAAEAKSAR